MQWSLWLVSQLGQMKLNCNQILDQVAEENWIATFHMFFFSAHEIDMSLMTGVVFAVLVVLSAPWTTIAMMAAMVIAALVIIIIVAVVAVVLMKR